MASTSTSTSIDVCDVSKCSSSLKWKTRQVSEDNVPLVLDENFFQVVDLHKYQEIVSHYKYLLEKENVMDTIILNKYVHRRCVCCSRYTCLKCLTIIFHHRDDFLLPYCHRCESFLQTSFE